MKKTYVLDTNVLIQSPLALLAFEDNQIVLPMVVLEELDKFKNDDAERGRNARQVIRFLEQLRQSGNLLEGVPLASGGTLRIESNFTAIKLPDDLRPDVNDNRILQICVGLSRTCDPLILVTKDIMVRLKSQMLGIPAEDFTNEQSPSIQEQYTGRMDAYAPDELLNGFRKKGMSPNELYIIQDGKRLPIAPICNQFFIIHSETSEKKTVLGRFDGKMIVPLKYLKEKPFGVSPRNVGQRFLQEALMLDAETAPLVIVRGAAGTAKTFYSLAVGLQRTFEKDTKKYRKILITRPNVQFDDDIGFLPGSEQEKIAPFLRPVIDNLELLVDQDDGERYRNEKELSGKVEELFSRGIVTAEAMNFIRGRSISQTYLIIDEAQNLTPKQAKGLITRVGSGTKVILLGDPMQIDNPLLDERTNGLSYASERMKGSPLCFQISMKSEECERSELAHDAASRM
ncbi:MAG: PhoH family protein [Lachnospiraceae bacterium]|nr:PhoH family protein [Lachnospiraceae bacterium]